MQAMSLQTRNDLHLKRKAFHASGVLIMFACFQSFPLIASWFCVVTAMGVTLTIDFVRLRKPKFNAFVIERLKYIIREGERHSYSAMAYLLTGVAISLLLFSPRVVALSLLFLALGDPFASGIGVRYGTTKWMGKKSIEGSAAAFGICFVMALLYYHFTGLWGPQLWYVAAISAAIGAVSEAIPLGKLDDNFSQPLICGFLLSGFFYLMNAL